MLVILLVVIAALCIGLVVFAGLAYGEGYNDGLRSRTAVMLQHWADENEGDNDRS